MNNIYIYLFLEVIICIGAIVIAYMTYDKKKSIFIASIIVALATLVGAFIFNEVPAPQIDRSSDYASIILSTDQRMTIEYKSSTDNYSNDKWTKYEEPIKLDKSTIIYARARTLWFTSEVVSRDVYITDNGLLYFSIVEQPGDTIVSITATYDYKDPVVNGEPGNHYEGYKIKKSDIKVVGVNLEGEEKEITDFTYTPCVLKHGKNTIKIEHFIADDISVDSMLYVNGDTPALIKLSAKYTGKNSYIGTILDSNNLLVKGIYEDATEKTITGYSISQNEIQDGKNKITVTKDNISTVVEITGIDRNTITENESEPNDELSEANDIDVNVNYSGTIKYDDDVDYYRLYLNTKGKINIKFAHPKLDDDNEFWNIALFSTEENNLIDFDSSGKNAETFSGSARVGSGIYYIRVTSKYSHSDEKYAMTVLFEEENDSYESEPNDDLSSQAMKITCGTQYTGNLTSNHDVDYYKFSISDKSKLWLDFSHDKINEEDTLWEVSVFGDSEDDLLKLQSSGESANMSSDCIRVPAGDYYICVKSYFWSNMDYTFSICTKKEGTNAESEDNGDYSLATKLNVGSSITGNLQSQEDSDFYTFAIKNKTSLQICFTHELTDNDSIFWKYELYSMDSSSAIPDENNNVTSKIRGDSAKNLITKWTSLPPGVYYIKVYSLSYSNSDYKLTIS